MFHINSAIAKNIAKDRDFENVINENFTQLLRGEHVNTSLSFDHDVNLHNALGKVDILDMHINNDGNIETYVLDTYDFNKGSSHWAVQKAHSAQEHHLISNYYTLTKVVKPL